MQDSFEAYMTEEAHLTREELRQVYSLGGVKKIRRRQLWLQEGDVCIYKMFVTNGLLRQYRLSDTGSEHILRFSAENSWLVDLESFIYATPAKYNIEALEDSEAVVWTKENFHHLFHTIKSFREYMQRLLALGHLADHERIMMNISNTPEEKYEHFIRLFPDVFNRVPLHMVASYLGVSRETLTRLRRVKAKL